MVNTTQTTNPIEASDWENYESKYNKEEVDAVKKFFTLHWKETGYTPEQMLEVLEMVDEGNYEGESWNSGDSEYGDGQSFCATYCPIGSDVKIGLDMTYSSWDSNYFNWEVGLVKYVKKTFDVPTLVINGK